MNATEPGEPGQQPQTDDWRDAVISMTAYEFNKNMQDAYSIGKYGAVEVGLDDLLYHENNIPGQQDDDAPNTLTVQLTEEMYEEVGCLARFLRCFSYEEMAAELVEKGLEVVNAQPGEQVAIWSGNIRDALALYLNSYYYRAKDWGGEEPELERAYNTLKSFVDAQPTQQPQIPDDVREAIKEGTP